MNAGAGRQVARRWIAIVLTAGLVLVGGGCIDYGDGNHSAAHKCANDYNAAWSSAPGLDLEHWEPRNCPVDIETNDQLTVGGTIIERGVTWPYDGSASSVTLDAWDYYNPSSFVGWDLLATDFEWFDFETPFGGEWVSQISLTYNFGANPNWLEFRVSGNFQGSPIAWVEINNGGPE